MVDSKIVKYVKDTLSKGFKEADIKAALLKQGWQDKEVNEAVSIARAEMPGPAVPAAKPQPVQQAQPAQPVQAQAAKPVQPAQEAKPSAQPVQQAAPVQPVQPAKPQPQAKVGVQQPAKPVSQPSARGWLTGGFLLTLIGGIVIITNSVTVYAEIGDMLSLFITNLEISVFSSLGFTLSAMDYLLINLIVGGFLVAASVIVMKIQQKATITGIFSIIISLIAILIGNGFMIGGIIGAVGGVFAVLRK